MAMITTPQSQLHFEPHSRSGRAHALECLLSAITDAKLAFLLLIGAICNL
ncbi:hypothetical protein [Xenorhabdus sp. PB30.3]|nr:hypothetical protein [Xenorhabdus sp. PB30.3]MCC8378664.1 hypothetical protein [Xenorhabdus sp. PB30.3]